MEVLRDHFAFGPVGIVTLHKGELLIVVSSDSWMARAIRYDGQCVTMGGVDIDDRTYHILC